MSFQERTEPKEVEAASSRLVRAVLPADDVSPRALLSCGIGSSRGFWARGQGWAAHAGEAATVTVTPDDGVGDRFEAVGRRGRNLAATDDPRPEGLPVEAVPPPRFYGGAAFRGDHRATGFWRGFPAARFVLPAVELEESESGRWLRGQELIEVGEDRDRARSRLETRLRALRESLRTDTSDEGILSAGAPGAITYQGSAEERGAWESAVEEALDEIGMGAFRKAVLARTLDVAPPAPLDPLVVLAHLRRQNPGSHVFMFEPEPGATLIGAAPEILATRLGSAFHATAVAGSVPRGDSEAKRRALSRKLLESEKDRAEHGYTVDDMVARLEPLLPEVQAEAEPHVLALAGIQHLETHIRSPVPDGQDVLSLLSALHPTPAVCGFPRDPALEFLRREEPFERGWYAGPVGWFDVRGNGIFVPALRSAVVRGGTWRLFAGAGIVAGSEPSLEWEETGIKFEPILRALAASRPEEEGQGGR